MVDGQRTDEGPWLYYKLANESKGSGELKTIVGALGHGELEVKGTRCVRDW